MDDDGKAVGNETVATVDLMFRLDIKKEIIEEALLSSTPECTLGHLARLAIHKRLGSSDQDRAVLLNDYCDAMRPYSQFVVFLACKIFWQSDSSDFFPKIKPMIEVCETLHRGYRMRLETTPAQIGSTHKPRFNRADYYDDPRENPIRRVICDFLLSKGEPDYFDMPSSSFSNYNLEIMAKSKYGWVSALT